MDMGSLVCVFCNLHWRNGCFPHHSKNNDVKLLQQRIQLCSIIQHLWSVGDNSSNKPLDGTETSKLFVDLSAEETAQNMKDPLQLESDHFGVNKKSTSHGGLAERMTARAGFGVLQIDTSRVSSFGAPIRAPVPIPPGVSPRELLESLVFLPNVIAQPSPTTGKLPFLMPNNMDKSK